MPSAVALWARRSKVAGDFCASSESPSRTAEPAYGAGSGKLRDCFFCDLFEGIWVLLCQNGQHFAVDGDIGLLEAAYEAGVGECARADHRLCAFKTVDLRIECRIDADVPELAEIVLLVATVRKGILAGVDDRFIRSALFLAACEAVAFDLLEGVAAAL